MSGVRSALIIPVPVADPLIGETRLAHDPSAAQGVPAHVTILFPWIPPASLTDEDRAAIRQIAAATPVFDFALPEFARFEDGPLYLRPEPSAPLVALIDAVAARWPAYPPYEGEFEVVVPHVTVAEAPDDVLVAELEARIGPALPLTTRAGELHLIVQDATTRRWEVDTRLPLA